MSLKNNKSLRRAKPLLGTIVDISLHSSSHSSEELADLINSCFTKIKNIQSKMSYFDQNSDIFRINHAPPGELITITQETSLVLKVGLKLYEDSHGTFDILYKGRVNNPNSQIEFHDSNIVSRNHFAEIDLGGIAKGYAADDAALMLREIPGVSGVINAGGDIVFFGEESFPLSIRSPQFDGRFFEAGYYSNCAIATSVFHHDNSPHSISVLASKCILADSLTKALWQQSKESKDYLLNRYEAKYMEIDSNLVLQNGELLN